MSKVKVQHYVPQFYLHYFTDAGGQVHVFDKTGGNVFSSNPKNIAGEGYFYDSKNDKAGEQFLETLFADLETNFAPLLASYIAGIRSGALEVMDEAMKGMLSKYLTLQILRTNETREHNFQLLSVLKNSILESGWLDEEGLKKYGLTEEQLDRKEKHLKIVLMNTGLRDALDQALLSHIWVIFRNTTGIPLWTSDHPVAKRANVDDPVRSMSGYTSEGIEISFPLAPDIMITLAERTFFKDLEVIENCVVPMDDEQNVIYCNSLQVMDSYRQVYSPDNNFELAKEMVTTHREMSDPKRKRVDVAK